MKFTYLFIDFFSLAIPFLFSFHPSIRFYKDFKAFFAANLISGLCFIAWDIIFTGKEIWGFSEKYTIGVKVYNLPLEEVLFFVCIPFACVFTYRCLNVLFKRSWDSNNEKRISIFLVVLFFIIGIWHWKKTYTATTFISFSLMLFLVRFIFGQAWLGNLYRAWFILLLPFSVVNGILTGIGLSSPVVWYNAKETVGIRILTIPVEDIIYGFELFMLTVFLYELFLPIFKRSGNNWVRLIIQDR